MRIRPRHIIVIVLGVITFLVFYLTAQVDRKAGPDALSDRLAPPLHESLDHAPLIALDNPVLEAGVVPHDRETRLSAPVYNRGGGVLEVRDVTSSCPLCVVGYFNAGDHRIRPEASSELQVVVRPSGIYGFHTVKTLSLTSNDPRNARMTLTVEAFVDPEFSVEPDTLDFGEVEKGAPAEAIVYFTPHIETPIHIVAAGLNAGEPTMDPHGDIVVEIESLREGVEPAPDIPAYRIRATLSPDIPAGPFSTPVFIHTDLERFSPYRITASGMVNAPYELDFSPAGPPLVLRRQTPAATVTVRADVPVDVAAFSGETGVVMVQLEQSQANLWQIRCMAHPDTVRGVHRDTVQLEITVDNRVYRERIPVRVYATGAQ